jgi:hypothetical protein
MSATPVTITAIHYTITLVSLVLTVVAFLITTQGPTGATGPPGPAGPPGNNATSLILPNFATPDSATQTQTIGNYTITYPAQNLPISSSWNVTYTLTLRLYTNENYTDFTLGTFANYYGKELTITAANPLQFTLVMLIVQQGNIDYIQHVPFTQLNSITRFIPIPFFGYTRTLTT